MRTLSPFLMCLLAGTGSILIGGDNWHIVTLIAVIFISLAWVIRQIRIDRGRNVAITVPGIISNFLSSFILYCFISYTIAFATLLLYTAIQ